ncbi:hypothetical protein GALLR39Z86_31110 [Glycomyces algeriensis]|uniref:Uncharacterized protein n=1 Tax=Glycomyces algeriensis TaxID=256037 RepID=A0A9W6LI26_9ACTN|nr:hypothetical protein GALLR39Z86_31110 [Glycomyces algeriensis]
MHCGASGSRVEQVLRVVREQLLERADHRPGVVALAGAQVVLGVAAELGRGRLRVAVRAEIGVGVREEPGQRRVRGAFGGAFAEGGGDEVLGGPGGGVGNVDELQDLPGVGGQQRGLELVELGGGAAARGLEVAAH